MRRTQLLLCCAIPLLVCMAPDDQKPNHTLRIVLHVLNDGRVGAHVSHYDGQFKVGADVDGHEIRVPFGKSKYHKLMSRDMGDRTTKDHPWEQAVENGEGGIYIMDLSDWDNHPDVSVEFYVDGVLRFRGHGSADNFDKWADKYYGPRTRKTDPREVAVDIGP